MGERDADEARRTSVFSARVVPIPAYGTKRIEMEYQERLASGAGSESMFAIPLRPDVYRAQTAGRLSITSGDASPRTRCAIFSSSASLIAMQTAAHDATFSEGEFQRQGGRADRRFFALKYGLDARQGRRSKLLTYRDGSPIRVSFEASALLALPANAQAIAPRTIVALFDTSLSMQWEKLEREFSGARSAAAIVASRRIDSIS